MPDGESLEDVRLRAMAVAARVMARHSGTVVLVSHRVIMKVLICSLLGLGDSSFWSIRMDTGAMTTFSHEQSRFVLEEHNNTCYQKLLARTGLIDF